MFEAKIAVADAVPVEGARSEATLRSIIDPLRDPRLFVTKYFARQSAVPAGSSPSLAAGYAATSPIARRRFDALLREAEAIGATGLKLMSRRAGRADPGTIAAARFLGSSLDATIRKLEALVLPSAV